jgi:hypothetical protein
MDAELIKRADAMISMCASCDGWMPAGRTCPSVQDLQHMIGDLVQAYRNAMELAQDKDDALDDMAEISRQGDAAVAELAIVKTVLSRVPRPAGWDGSVQDWALLVVGQLRQAEKRAGDATRFVSDLDRCTHGRHEGDRCSDCPGGISVGNWKIREGVAVGHTYDGRPYRMPARGLRHEVRNWIVDSADDPDA